MVSVRSFHISGLALVLFLSSCGKNSTLKINDQDVLAYGSVDSCNFVQNTQGLRVSWKSESPVHFIIGPTVPPEYDSTILQAANIWNQILNKSLISVERNNGLTNTAGNDRCNLIYWMTEWPEDQKNQQARTTIRWSVSKLFDADIKINAKDYSYFTVGDHAVEDKISLLSIMIHEIGHGLGLSHIYDSSSVMQTYLAAGVNRDTPAQVDIESLKCEY